MRLRGTGAIAHAAGSICEEMLEWSARCTGCASGMAFMAETGSGHLLTIDGAPDGGGRNLAPRPMETVLAGTGGCTAYDVVTILKRGRHDVRGCPVKLQAERATTDPKVFTRIHMHFMRQRAQLECRSRGARGGAVAREVLLSHRDAGQDRRDHDQPRDRRGLSARMPTCLRCGARFASSRARPVRIASCTGAGQRRGAALFGSRMRARLRRASSARRWRATARRGRAAGRDGRPGAAPPAARSRRRSPGSSDRRRSPRPGRSPNAPAYHSGFNRLVRAPSCSRRRSVQAR